MGFKAHLIGYLMTLLPQHPVQEMFAGIETLDQMSLVERFP